MSERAFYSIFIMILSMPLLLLLASELQGMWRRPRANPESFVPSVVKPKTTGDSKLTQARPFVTEGGEAPLSANAYRSRIAELRVEESREALLKLLGSPAVLSTSWWADLSSVNSVFVVHETNVVLADYAEYILPFELQEAVRRASRLLTHFQQIGTKDPRVVKRDIENFALSSETLRQFEQLYRLALDARDTEAAALLRAAVVRAFASLMNGAAEGASKSALESVMLGELIVKAFPERREWQSEVLAAKTALRQRVEDTLGLLVSREQFAAAQSLHREFSQVLESEALDSLGNKLRTASLGEEALDQARRAASEARFEASATFAKEAVQLYESINARNAGHLARALYESSLKADIEQCEKWLKDRARTLRREYDPETYQQEREAILEFVRRHPLAFAEDKRSRRRGLFGKVVSLDAQAEDLLRKLEARLK